MGELHQLLAVEPELKAAAARESKRIVSLFKDGAVRLTGIVRVYTPIEDGGEEFPSEVVPLATTVESELEILHDAFVEWIDASIQKEVTNQQAMAVLDLGEVWGDWELPATALLNLEGKLAEIRQIYAAIPTLDPTKIWNWDKADDVFESEPDIRYRSNKLMRSLVLYDATPEHPAQVETFTEDVRVGYTTSTVQSGAITKALKRDYLERIDELIKRVKTARQEANTADVVDINLAEKIVSFIQVGP